MTEFKRTVTDPEAFGRVAVLMGGDSAEREISLKSGNQVLAGLKESGIEAHKLDATGDFLTTLQTGNFDRVFNILHGPGGEDGVIQGVLEVLGIPYTGSGVLGSALCMDKVLTKQIWSAVNLPSPPSLAVSDAAELGRVGREIGFPLCAKPVHEGSSLGMTKVDNEKQLEAAFLEAKRFEDFVLLEKWITGPEYTTCILDNRVMPIIRIETPREFYDYEAKYFSDSTRYYCPSGLDANAEKRFGELSMRAFEALKARGWGRVDFMLDEQGNPWLLEANTQPGMTDHSLIPMAASAIGIDFKELVWLILEETMYATRN
ncbi:MAG: D-alanine--D-alanine ligase [Gammaproteobacteria bacterium]